MFISAMKKFVFLACLLLSCVNAQDLEALIGEVFPKPGGDTAGGGLNLQPTDTGPDNVPVSGSCTCVPYYLCNNNTIIKDGNGLIDIRIQDGPCNNYIEVCCEVEQIVEERITPPPPVDEKPPGCGFRNPDGVGFRITGDQMGEAQFGEFPWMVAILREEPVEASSSKLNVYQCGGSLIHPRAVLTAAHCVSGRVAGKKLKIRAGEWDTQTKNEIFPHQDRDVVKVIAHKNYHAGTLYNDIALLILASPVEITDNVNVVCLPPQGATIDQKECYASGWGKDVFGKEGKYQVILKKVELPIVNHADCQKELRTTRLGKFFELHRTFICAGGSPGKDTCKGDGGSPLVCPIPGHPDQYQQAGIVAWGIGCGDKTPGVYANVAMFRDWINEHMSYEKLETSSYSY